LQQKRASQNDTTKPKSNKSSSDDEKQPKSKPDSEEGKQELKLNEEVSFSHHSESNTF